MEKLQYLASPYSHPDAWMRELRFRAVSRVAARLAVERGIMTFCPVAHTHPFTEEMAGAVSPTDHDFWLRWDHPFEEMCVGLIICQLPWWTVSKGVSVEIARFKAAGKPVEKLYPGRWFTATEWAMLSAGGA